MRQDARSRRRDRVGRTFVGVCTVEDLVLAAVKFGGGNPDLVSLIVGLVYLLRRLPPFRGVSARRLLVDPFTRRELPDGWDHADDVKDGNWYGFSPTGKIAFLWKSGTGCRLLAIPVTGDGGTLLGYALELTLAPGQGSHYAGVMRKFNVNWQEGTLPEIGEGEEKTGWLKRLLSHFQVLKQAS